jgi:hypothetical protein
MNTHSDSRFAVPHVMELSELELETIAGGGWFKRLTGISTPRFLKRFDDGVRAVVPGGWKTVAQKLIRF